MLSLQDGVYLLCVLGLRPYPGCQAGSTVIEATSSRSMARRAQHVAHGPSCVPMRRIALLLLQASSLALCSFSDRLHGVACEGAVERHLRARLRLLGFSDHSHCFLGDYHIDVFIGACCSSSLHASGQRGHDRLQQLLFNVSFLHE